RSKRSRRCDADAVAVIVGLPELRRLPLLNSGKLESARPIPPGSFHIIASQAPSVGRNWRSEHARGKKQGGSGMYLLALFRAITAVLTHRRYRPERHYMRGPGPKWYERHGR